MPRLPTDCSKYIMYKLCCLDPNIPDEYVGSTINFTERKSKHKSNCNIPNSKDYNSKLYQFIRLNGGWNNWTMIQIEPYNCNSKREAEAREEYWRKELKTTLNMKRAFRTEEEKLEQKKKNYEDNKDERLEQMKIYNEQHRDTQLEQKKEYYHKYKDELLEQKKEYYENKKDEIKTKQLEHYHKNKDAINAKKKLYREQNKDAINAKRREKNRLKKEQE
jgi:hypothetical protein